MIADKTILKARKDSFSMTPDEILEALKIVTSFMEDVELKKQKHR